MKVIGIDPALRNTGIAVAEVDIETGHFDVLHVDLVETVAAPKKMMVRKSSDDLEAATAMFEGVMSALKRYGAKTVMVEVPTGTQSARGSISNGICIGVIGSLKASGIQVIEVSPKEVKQATKLAGTAGKEPTKVQIIEWASQQWPDAGWFSRGGKMVLKNEHPADACAIIAAGIETPLFLQAVEFMKNMQQAA